MWMGLLLEVIEMNKQRAQEITVSPVMADVTYNGASIYIQHVDLDNETARIYPLDQPENEQEVPIHNLQENGPEQDIEGVARFCPLP